MKSILLRIFKFGISLLSKVPLAESEFMYLRGFGYDPGVKVEIQQALSLISPFPKEKSLVVFDVGANTGDYSAAFLEVFPSCTIHAFEPSPSVKSQLDVRFENETRVQSYKFGFSNEEGKVTLFSNDLDGGLSSMVKRNLSHLELAFDSSIEVEVKRLDTWVSRSGILPDVVKIDVEGFEFHVLEGAGDLLQNIKLIQFEFGGTDIDSRIFFRDFWYLLSEAGFELFRLTPTGPTLISKYSENLEVFVFSNYYAVNRRYRMG